MWSIVSVLNQRFAVSDTNIHIYKTLCLEISLMQHQILDRKNCFSVIICVYHYNR